MDKVALGQVFLRSLRLFPVKYHFILAFHAHASPGG
jgi:hypothetical protein